MIFLLMDIAIVKFYIQILKYFSAFSLLNVLIITISSLSSVLNWLLFSANW